MGSGASTPRESSVVVIGVGYAGGQAARGLDAKGFRVTAINSRGYMLHSVGALRALCDPTYEDSIAVPLNSLFKSDRSQLVTGAAAVTPDASSPSGLAVRVGDKVLKPSFVVIATGSSYPGIHPNATTIPEVKREMQTNRAAVARARRIVIFGGGAVGCELAGELRHFYPDKAVTLIHSGAKLISGGAAGLKDKFKDKVHDGLVAAGVTVVLNDRISVEEENVMRGQGRVGMVEGERTLTTVSGKQYGADLVFFCIGARINSDAYREPLRASVNVAGRLEVNANLQVRGYERVFAVGDCANLESMMAFVAGNHAAHVVNAIDRMDKGRAAPPVKLSPIAMLVTNGPNKGSAQLPMFGGMLAGDGMSSSIKSKKLFTEQNWKAVGQKWPGNAVAAR